MINKIQFVLITCALIFGLISTPLPAQSQGIENGQTIGLKIENLSLGYGNAFLLSAFGKPSSSQYFENIDWMVSEPVSGIICGLTAGVLVGFTVAGITKDSGNRINGLTVAQLSGLCTYPFGCATGIFVAGKIFEEEVGVFPWALLGSVAGIAIDILTGLNYPVFSTIGGMVAYRLTLKQKR